MAWNDLASNQIPTFTDLQTAGFALKAGQSHVTSNECITKSQALAKYNLSTSLMGNFSNNQLVPKSNYGTTVTSYSFDFSSAFANGILALNASSVSTSITLYSATANLIVGTVFYTDSTLTTVFPGNNNFYLGTNASQSIYRKYYQINNSGQILQFN